MAPRKKKNRRNSTKYPALKPEYNLKSRYELFDQDYINKLSDSEKEWLNKFNEEYVNDKINRKNLDKNFHNTEELKKDCDDRNNARNRCVLTRSRASGRAVEFDVLREEDHSVLSPEDQLIAKENIERLERRKRRQKALSKS